MSQKLVALGPIPAARLDVTGFAAMAFAFASFATDKLLFDRPLVIRTCVCPIVLR
jgi:hypothetical protein